MSNYLEVFMKLLLRGWTELGEQFGELVVTQGAPGGDHLHAGHDLQLVPVSVVSLVCGSHVLPQLSDCQDDVWLLEEHQGLHIDLQQLC